MTDNTPLRIFLSSISVYPLRSLVLSIVVFVSLATRY
jgi:hypothetical protein